jgi:hypothetical protein
MATLYSQQQQKFNPTRVVGAGVDKPPRPWKGELTPAQKEIGVEGTKQPYLDYDNNTVHVHGDEDGVDWRVRSYEPIRIERSGMSTSQSMPGGLQMTEEQLQQKQMSQQQQWHMMQAEAQMMEEYQQQMQEYQQQRQDIRAPAGPDQSRSIQLHKSR